MLHVSLHRTNADCISLMRWERESVLPAFRQSRSWDAISFALRSDTDRQLSQTIQQLSPSCPSGKCTWASVDSLAVCSRSRDIQRVRSYPTFDQQCVLFALDNPGASSSNSTDFVIDNGRIENMDGWTYTILSTNEVVEVPAATILAVLLSWPPTELATQRPQMFQDTDALVSAWSITQALPYMASNNVTRGHRTTPELQDDRIS